MSKNKEVTLEESVALHSASIDAEMPNAAPVSIAKPPAKTSSSYYSGTEWEPLTLDTILSFGKHKGMQVEDVIEDHPSYIQWMLREDVRQFDEETLQLLEKKGII